MRPFALADDWDLDRRDTLTVFLRGVDAGLLDLTWELIYPSCRTGSDRMIALDSAGSPGEARGTPRTSTPCSRASTESLPALD